MKKTETKSGAGSGVSDAQSPVGEVKAAMAGFVSQINGFQAEMRRATDHAGQKIFDAGSPGAECGC